jgi:hypothetical protein
VLVYSAQRIPARFSSALELTVAVRGVWSRFASPRAELVGSPSLSRPNLFAGD